MVIHLQLKKIKHIVASDLMSEVLVAEEENLLLITALNTEQTIRTAHIVDALGILLVNGKKTPTRHDQTGRRIRFGTCFNLTAYVQILRIRSPLP